MRVAFSCIRAENVRADYSGSVKEAVMNNAGASETGGYYIHPFGCQMNVHDSEYIAGILETLGYRAAPSATGR